MIEIKFSIRQTNRTRTVGFQRSSHLSSPWSVHGSPTGFGRTILPLPSEKTRCRHSSRNQTLKEYVNFLASVSLNSCHGVVGVEVVESPRGVLSFFRREVSPFFTLTPLSHFVFTVCTLLAAWSSRTGNCGMMLVNTTNCASSDSRSVLTSTECVFLNFLEILVTGGQFVAGY